MIKNLNRIWSIYRNPIRIMDISNPTIIRINNRNYRCLHPTNFKQRAKQPANRKRVIVDEYDDEETYVDFQVTEPSTLDEKLDKDDEDLKEQDDDRIEVDKLTELIKSKEVRVEPYEGRFMCPVHVPASLRGYLIGKNCANIKEICSKAKVEIDFPEQHRKEEPFLIVGPDERSVLSAYLNIHERLQLKRKILTHFLAIRCDNQQTKSSYEKFKEIVLAKYLPQAYSDKVFIGAGKLHLTISTFALLDNYERNRMVSYMNKSLGRVIDEVLKEKKDCLKDKKFQFNIGGLDYMNDDPTSVRILYAKVQDSSQLIQTLCNKISVASNKLGLTSDYRPNVKLHMTLMNTRYIRKQGKQFESFDATQILKEFKDYHFGTVDLNEIHLLISGTEDEAGGYKSTHKINVF